MNHWLRIVLLAVVPAALAGLSRAQEGQPGKEDDEIQKAGLVDPFTEGAEEAMKAAGIVRYGPIPFGNGFTTKDIDAVLGENRVLWMETEHFCIGSSLKTFSWPDRSAERKALQEEFKLLHKKLPKLPERPKKITPWMRLHLTALRCEQAYADFLELVGQTDADFGKGATPGQGPYLGLPGKFLVIVFQKKSDMARYMDRFCSVRDDTSMRVYLDKTHQQLFCLSAEGLEGFDDSGLHGHLLHGVWHNMANGYRGYGYPLPLWLLEGIAHYHSRKVPSQFLNVQIRDDEAVAEHNQNNWPAKVRARAQHEGAFFPFAKMVEWSDWKQMGYHAHAQSWSRVDYLMHVDRQKVGAMLVQLKSVPITNDFDGQGAQLRAMAQRLLFDLFELDAETFDKNWRDWVLKTYPKR